MKKNLIIGMLALALIVLAVVIGIVTYTSNKPMHSNVPMEVPHSKSDSSLSIDPQTDRYMIEQSDSGKTLTFKQGEKFEISLPGLLQGDSWGNPEFDTAVLHLDDRHDIPVPKVNFDSVDGNVWTFSSLKPGTTDIEIANTPTPEDSAASVFYKVTVVIR